MKKTINVNPYLLIGIAIMGLLLWIQSCHNKNQSNKADLQLIAALQDSIKYWKNKDSNNVATIDVIMTAQADDFLNMRLKDKELTDLQATVKDYKNKLKAGSSVTNALMQTVADLKGKKPEIIYQKGDTLWKDSVAYITATYKDSVVNDWIKLYATMGKDSSNFHVDVTNKFSAIVGYRKRKPFVDLITENPYTTVKSLRTYQVSVPKPKKFGIGFSTGVTVDYNLKPIPYVGIGLNYTILRL